MFRNSVFLGPLEQVSSWWIENLSKVSKTDFSHFTLRGFQRKKSGWTGYSKDFDGVMTQKS